VELSVGDASGGLVYDNDLDDEVMFADDGESKVL